MLLYQEDISNILASSTSWREREYVQFVFFRILFAMKITLQQIFLVNAKKLLYLKISRFFDDTKMYFI